MARSFRFRPGFRYVAPARQTAFRLSQQQRADLADALDPHPLTRPLLQAIEDRLYVYWETTARQRSAPKTIAAWQKQIRRGERLARELRELLPVVEKAFEQGFLKNAEPNTSDDDLSRLLERRALVWKQIADNLPPPQKHRPENSEVSWLGLFVVEKLAAANVPLTLGRKSVVVEVLGLVYRWATTRAGQRLPDNKWSSFDYEYSRVMVESYHSNLAERRRFDEAHPRSRKSR